MGAQGDEFIHSGNRQPVRFWAVNGPPSGLAGVELQQTARRLAKYGVNVARMHSAIFDKAGNADAKKIRHAQEAVAALMAEGIYAHFSVYFPRVKNLQGTVRFKNGTPVQIQPLDFNGYPKGVPRPAAPNSNSRRRRSIIC